MSPQRFAVLGVLGGTLVLHGWVAAGLAGLGSRGDEIGRMPSAVGLPPTTAMAKRSGDAALHGHSHLLPPVPSTLGPMQGNVAVPERPAEVAETPPQLSIASASVPGPMQGDVDASAGPVEIAAIASLDGALPASHRMLPAASSAPGGATDSAQDDVAVSAPPLGVAGIESNGAVSPDTAEVMPRATPPVRLVSLFRPDSWEEDYKPAAPVIETPNECLVAEICIDDYLWAFYERTPKVDTNKLIERVKVTIKRKNKLRTVIKTNTKYVVADFAWKDPIAAQRAGMSLKDYVIGGMDRGFRVKLYHALRAMDEAGLMPGITSAFRDDYRQTIASGKKAASDSSYHGGSRRGGYGCGLAADLVSVKGGTRLERFASSVELWKWIDAHEKELGIGRPYLNRDPPHVGPIDGQEYAAKRGGAKVKLAMSPADGRHPVAAAGNPRVVKPAAKAGSVRVGSIQP